GQRLVDDGHARRALAVAFGELAPAHERRPHRLKIIRPHDVEARARGLLAARRGPPLGDHLTLRVREAERRETHEARALHPGLRACASSAFRAVTMSTREACSAGASPKTTPVETETAKVKASTR